MKNWLKASINLDNYRDGYDNSKEAVSMLIKTGDSLYYILTCLFSFNYLLVRHKARRVGTTKWPTLSLSVLSIPLLNNEAFAYLIIISCYEYIIDPFFNL